MAKPALSREAGSELENPSSSRPRILCLGGAHDGEIDLRHRLGDDVEIVELSSSLKALAQMARDSYAAVYVDADHFAEASDVGQLLQNDLILQGMSDGVVLLDTDNTILWSNGRLREWSEREEVIGENLYRVLNSAENLSPEICPLKRALADRNASAATIRGANKFYRLHAAPVAEAESPPQYLVVTIRDVTAEVLQQQKLAAIHQAGVELADLTTEEVSSLDYGERIALLKDNILHCVQDVLHLDVVEIRMIDPETHELISVMAYGMEPAAEERTLFAKEADNGVTGFVAATGKSYLCGHTTEDPLYIEGARGARSSLTVPLTLHEEVIGTLNVESPEANAFNESDLQFLEIFARSVAIALNTLDLLAAEKATTAAASVEAIHSAVALPVDDILNDAVNVMERYIGHQPDVVELLQRILCNARDIKRVIQKVGQNMAPTEALPAGTAAESRPALAGKRVLVVDEDAAVRSAAHELLERYRCVVETAHDGREARNMVRNLDQTQAYDVIIADIRLPDMSGYELLVTLREVVDDVPLVLMTGFGYDPGHSLLRARKEGLTNVLYKPFRLDQLVTTIEEVIKSRERQG